MSRHIRKQVRRAPQEDPSTLDDLNGGLGDLDSGLEDLSAASDFDADTLELVADVRRLDPDGDDPARRFGSNGD